MTSHIVHCKVAKLKPHFEVVRVRRKGPCLKIYFFSYQVSEVGRPFQEKLMSNEEEAIKDFEQEENKVNDSIY